MNNKNNSNKIKNFNPPATKKNYIMQQYVSSQTNHVICMDVTDLGNDNGFIFSGMDLAARNFVGHAYKKEPFQVSEVIQILNTIITDRSFLPEIQIIHTDRATLFKNQRYEQFVENKSIKVSRGSADGHSNQVIESSFRTVKNIMKRFLQPQWKVKQPNLLDKKLPDNFDISGLVFRAITDFNNRPHISLAKLTPNQMEEALYEHYNKTNIQKNNTEGALVPLLAKNDDSEQGYIAKTHKVSVIEDYANSWKDYLGQLNVSVKEGFQIIYQQNVHLAHQNKRLYDEALEAKKTLKNVEEEILIMKESRLNKELLKVKRKNAIKQDVRETIDEDEFIQILESIKFDHFVASRKKVALILLYCTGLRVSNLLVFNVKHMEDLTKKGETHVPLIKTRKIGKKHLVALGQRGKELLKKYKKNLFHLMVNKNLDDPIFTTQANLKKPIHRVSFDYELNKVLTKASEVFHKHLRTHSFRASIITDFLKSHPIDVVKELIGHRDIKTTLHYKRGGLTNHQLKDVYKSLDKTRAREGKL